MHHEAYEYVRTFGSDREVVVYEVGSRNLNGSVRDHWPHALWFGIDKLDGPGVDLVVDGAYYMPGNEQFDLAICCEVFEHTYSWRAIIDRMRSALKPGGRIIITCAALGRQIHSEVDGGPILATGEWYSNIDPDELATVLCNRHFINAVITVRDTDVYATAVKPS